MNQRFAIHLISFGILATALIVLCGAEANRIGIFLVLPFAPPQPNKQVVREHAGQRD